MGYTSEELNAIYDRNGGSCHLCGQRLAFRNYGKKGKRGAWEVDHSVAKARGGTNRQNNLRSACISCNRSKKAADTRSIRARNGLARGPMSTARRASARSERIVSGVLIGGALGALLGGRFGAIAGATVGCAVGAESRPS